MRYASPRGGLKGSRATLLSFKVPRNLWCQRRPVASEGLEVLRGLWRQARSGAPEGVKFRQTFGADDIRAIQRVSECNGALGAKRIGAL